ncbi:MAG: hypothetical protein WD077_06730 [Bacteroidia bacterium]
MKLMKFFDLIKNRFFPDPANPAQPVIHEVLKRRQLELQQYEEWKAGGERASLTEFLCTQYHRSKSEQEDQAMVRVLTTVSSKGFLLRFPASVQAAGFQHFFDLLKDKFLEDGYRLYASDRKIYNRKEFAETIERHYLKPSIERTMPFPLDQRFGNISVELVKINDRPTHIKLLCNSYSDAKYLDAQGMDEMMAVICGE